MLSSLFDCWGGDLSVNNPPVNSQSSHFCNTEEKKKNYALSPERKSFCQMGTVLFVM